MTSETGRALTSAPVQVRLERLWSESLHISPIGPHDDFFELGGDSLTAAELQVAIDAEFGVSVSATTLFLSPTIGELGKVIEEALGEWPAPGATGDVA